MGRVRTTLIALLAIALMATACGGDDGGADADADAAGATDAAEVGADDATAADDGAADDGAAGGGATEGGDDASVSDSPDDGVESDTITLGWLGDLTGPTATATAVSLEGSQAYFDMVNAEGGVLGREVVIESRDDQFDAERAVSNYGAVVQDENALALISLAGSHIGAALAPDIEIDQIPMIGPGQTTEVQLENPYIFHTLAHYADMADVIVARAIEQVGSAEDLRMVNYSLEVPSGEEFAGYITERVEAAGGQIVGSISVAASGADYRTAAIQLQDMVDNGDANYIAGLATAPNFLGLVTEMTDLGIDLPLAGMQAAVTPSIFREGPDAMSDILIGIQSFMPCNVDVPGNEVIQSVVEGTEAADNCLQPSWALGWVNAKVVHEAMLRAAEESGELTRATLFEALQGSFEMDGVTCDIDWTESNYSPCATPFEWTGDGFEPIAEFSNWTDVILETGAGS